MRGSSQPGPNLPVRYHEAVAGTRGAKGNWSTEVFMAIWSFGLKLLVETDGTLQKGTHKLNTFRRVVVTAKFNGSPNPSFLGTDSKGHPFGHRFLAGNSVEVSFEAMGLLAEKADAEATLQAKYSLSDLRLDSDLGSRYLEFP